MTDHNQEERDRKNAYLWALVELCDGNIKWPEDIQIDTGHDIETCNLIMSVIDAARKEYQDTPNRVMTDCAREVGTKDDEPRG